MTDTRGSDEQRLWRVGWVLLVGALLCGAVILASSTFSLGIQWLRPAPAVSGDEGWWFRCCAIDAGQLRYLSYGFLGMRGASAGGPPYRGLEDKMYVVQRDRPGLSLWSVRFPTLGGRFELALPIWPPAAVFVCGGTILLRRAARLRRARQDHLCLNCGYDLRASKDRCPECGTAIPAVREHAGTESPEGEG